MTDSPLLPIGQLADRTGVAVSAIRHYGDVGVLQPAVRIGGARHFSDDAVGRVNFVRRAQRFGFSLAEIRGILDDTSGATHRIVEVKLASLRSQQEELAMMISLLEEMKACGCQVVAECPALGNRLIEGGAS